MSSINNQAFFVIADDSYDRMFASLQDGTKFVKSHLHQCLHKEKSKCQCEFALNFLNKDNKMVRVSNGKLKRVIRQSDLQRKESINQQRTNCICSLESKDTYFIPLIPFSL